GIGTMPITLYGTEEQKQKYVPQLAMGEVFGAYCLTEPGAGSDANSGKTKAVLSEDGTHYLISGQKMWISNAGFASTFIVFARIEDDKNITGFIVEYDPENPNGMTLGEEEHKLGIHSSSTRQVFFNETKVPVENMLSNRGDGFKIAMKDLEIRGAGDILGGEQSGFINEIGFETYQKILAEAIEELKEKEFKSLYQGQEEKDKKWIKETVIDTDFELLFPSEYVNNISERLNLYHKLGELKDETELQAFQKELEDRFGPLPEEAQDLLDSVRIKWMALDLGLERVLMKKNKMVGYFISDQQSGYYQSNTFGKVLNYVQQHPDKVNMTEKQTRSGLKLLLRFGTIKSVPQALAALNPLHQATQK
ncbi:TRCF domain-containing protein, partial [Gilvibacter sp.]|uniref:TRCF domain-containing protein n=1 Tax=Gilvibacter sp. TaxID=2729997 RepID=UPI0035BE4CE2